VWNPRQEADVSQFQANAAYEIPRTTGVCASTGRTLEPGEAYFAVLIDVPVELRQAESTECKAADLGLQRVDVSTEAWEGGYRPEHLFSYWRSTVPQPNAKKKLFVDDGVLMNLLRRLADTAEPQRLAFRYVLALILMRKKLLRYDGAAVKRVEHDGGSVERTFWLLTPKLDVTKGHFGRWNEEETLEVLDPGLDETQIEQVTQQLGEILEAEL
jgi:hypothetical protein